MGKDKGRLSEEVKSRGRSPAVGENGVRGKMLMLNRISHKMIEIKR